MSEQGKLVIVKEGNNFRPKIEFKGKKLDIKVDHLSKSLGQAYRSSPESVQGKEVVFEWDRNGAPTRIAEVGKGWEKPGEPGPASAARISAAMPAAAGVKITTVKQVTSEGLVLSNGERVSKRDTAICELKASVNKPVVRKNNMLIRIDYQYEKPSCYPFNFAAAPKAYRQTYVPVPEAKQDAKATKDLVSKFFRDHLHLDHGRFAPNAHSGVIEVELTALSPLIVSHPPGRDGILSKEEQDAMETVCNAARQNSAYGETEIDGRPNKPATRDEKMQRIRPPYQVDSEKYALPATSLKGMLRSMVEAYSHSFMGSLSGCLRGDADEGKAQIRSRTNWRAGKAGLKKGDETIYTYEWDMKAKTWKRWVAKGNTPWNKLSHVNPEVNPLALSLADAMFGRVFPKNKEAKVKSALPALRGRIRISEGVGWDDNEQSTVKAADDYWFLKSLTRPSGAKAKCEALYLLPDTSGKVEGYNHANSEARGRKMYWPHSLGDATQRGSKPLTWMRDKIAAKSQKELWQDAEFNAAVKAFQERVGGQKESQASTKSWVKPLLPGSTFRFSIRFENLTSVELGALLKAVELENKADPATHCHRLGRAKPLGFGSVTLSIKAINLWDARLAAANLKPAEEFWVNDAQKDATITTARDKFADFCKPWKTPVWEDIADLTAIPTGLTDLDYWKNWSDYQPWKNKDYPLPLPREAAPK